jgi:transcription elongation factor Elf1
LPQISYTATFKPDDSLDRILEDLACPVCRHKDPGATHHWISESQMRIFCEGCGAFVTVRVSREQATAIHRWSQSMPTITDASSPRGS